MIVTVVLPHTPDRYRLACSDAKAAFTQAGGQRDTEREFSILNNRFVVHYRIYRINTTLLVLHRRNVAKTNL